MCARCRDVTAGVSMNEAPLCSASAAAADDDVML